MISITTDSLPVGIVGEPYDFTLTAAVDPPAKVIWGTANALPPDLILDAATGRLSGICKKENSSSIIFTAKVDDPNRKEATSKPILLFINQPKSEMLIGSVTPYAGPVNADTRKDLESKGWLFCDGAAIDRLTYADLFHVISIIYGGGDGVNTFNLPNYQGQFLRGVSNQSGVDPDANGRTPQQNPGGASGSASGNSVGSFQADDFKSHNHALSKWTRSFKGSDDPDKPYDDQGELTGYTNNTGGNETRPKNVYVNYLIRFKE